MNVDRKRPISLSVAPSLRGGMRFLLAVVAIALFTGLSRADVVGRLKFAVKNAADEKPIAGAKIVLKDSANARPDVTLTTDANGSATTPLLENRPWRITTTAEKFQTDTRSVTVSADVTTDVEILLEPLEEKVIKITGQRQLVNSGNTASSTARSQEFFQKFPVTAGNPQSLTKAVRANPGFVEDSVNQAHPRGEHSQTSIYVNGFLVPGALQGRAGQFLAPEAVQTFDVQTGGYAPEYGGETGAILNLSLRSGTIKPLADATLRGGGFSTFSGSLSVGGQAGAALGVPNAEGGQAKRFSYLFNATQYNTDNALEPPQPDRQSAHNKQSSTTVFGNLGYTLGPNDTLSLLINTAPARTEVANRTGLPGKYAPYGQGFGYAGHLTAADAAAQGIKSQQDDGQDIYQNDANTFTALQYRKQFSPTTTSVFTIGYSDSRLDIKNKNPGQFTNPIVDSATLLPDSSVEFSPTAKRNYQQFELAANVTLTQIAEHTLKFGAVYQNQKGRESYKFIPGSQLALNALYATDPRLAPAGGTVQTGEDGEPVTDDLGNPVYILNDPTATPTLDVKRDGYYAALYAQDTWKVTPRFSFNYGLRLDNYKQNQNLGQENVTKTELSPRVNAAYTIAPLTVARASYNRLFTQPPLAQGAIIGVSIQPQLVNQYEVSVERQFAGNQVAKVAYYQKDFHNLTDTGILIEGTQIGLYTTHNLQKAKVKGTEFSYSIEPRNGLGVGGYLVWANTVSKPSGIDSFTGEEVADPYTDHDQHNTVGAGVNYTHTSGANAGLNLYYGSGLASSVLYDGGPRQQRTEVNLLLSSGPRLIRSGLHVDLEVQNLFDSKQVINFNSAFSGTRFQQGRRVLLNIGGRF